MTHMETTKWAKPADSSIKPELRVGKRTCQCQMCGDYFGSPYVFDRHLLGVEDARCKDDAERRAAGLYPNEHGVWLSGGPKIK